MVQSDNSNAKKQRRTLFNVVVLVLVIALASTSVLSGILYHNYERVLASEPHYTYPQYSVQSLNTSMLQGPLENGGIVGIKVNLSWPAHVYGPLNYNGPVDFFILWSSHNYPSRFSSAISDDKNWSIYFLGPVNNATVSISLPPGSYYFCVAFPSSTPTSGILHINVDYSYFTQ